VEGAYGGFRIEGTAGGMKRPSQVVCGRPPPEVGPEEVHQLLAVEGVPRGERQQLHEALGLPQTPRPFLDGSRAHRDCKASQKVHTDRGKAPGGGSAVTGGVVRCFGAHPLVSSVARLSPLREARGFAITRLAAGLPFSRRSYALLTQLL
jgi:hypothetical protein